MDSKDLKNQAAEEVKALELDDLDQVTGGAGLGGHDVVSTQGTASQTASGVLKQVASGVLNQGVSGVGHEAFSTKGVGLSDEIEGMQSSNR